VIGADFLNNLGKTEKPKTRRRTRARIPIAMGIRWLPTTFRFDGTTLGAGIDDSVGEVGEGGAV